MNRKDDDKFSDTIARRLRDSEDQLDELTLARLRAARLRAVEAARPARSKLLLASGFAGAAAVVVLAFGVWWTQPGPVAPPLEDMQLLTAGDDLPLMEDLDFYLWLEYEQPELG